MALDQSALLDLLAQLKLTDVTDRVRTATETLYQELIDAEAAAVIGAGRYERCDERVTQRNGTRARTFSTRTGDLELRIPKLRQGSFFPSLLERRRRVDQALFAVVMEAYLHGVSTRKVDDLVKALGADTGISKSEVSRICEGLDAEVGAFTGRDLSAMGVGITTAVAALGIRVVEVNRTRPAERRKQGKTDQLDAYRAARSVLSGEATTDPKNASIEPLRALNVARRSAVKAQQAAWRQIGALLVNAPSHLRDRYRDLPDTKLIATLANTRPDQVHANTEVDTLHALRSLARRHRTLGEEIADLEPRI